MNDAPDSCRAAKRWWLQRLLLLKRQGHRRLLHRHRLHRIHVRRQLLLKPPIGAICGCCSTLADMAAAASAAGTALLIRLLHRLLHRLLVLAVRTTGSESS